VRRQDSRLRSPRSCSNGSWRSQQTRVIWSPTSSAVWHNARRRGEGSAAGGSDADLGRWGIHVTRKRLLGIENCRAFEVLNLGKYERQYWQGVTFGERKEKSLK